MSEPWTIEQWFRTQTVFGPIGSGDKLDQKELNKIRDYVAKLRGIIIHEVTALEDEIEKTILENMDPSVLADTITIHHLETIKDSFEKKKLLLKKVVAKFSEAEISDENMSDLDWLQRLRNDFAHGKEYVHSSYTYAEIRNKKNTHKLPDWKLIHRFHHVLLNWHNILEKGLSNKSVVTTPEAPPPAS